MALKFIHIRLWTDFDKICMKTQYFHKIIFDLKWEISTAQGKK